MSPRSLERERKGFGTGFFSVMPFFLFSLSSASPDSRNASAKNVQKMGRGESLLSWKRNRQGGGGRKSQIFLAIFLSVHE